MIFSSISMVLPEKDTDWRTDFIQHAAKCVSRAANGTTGVVGTP
jgi:hypothetical protein